jgi:hypothetical protein
MAKQYIDAAITTAKESMTVTDGTALTLTNGVRLLWDDALDKATLIVLIDRIKERIRETELQ